VISEWVAWGLVRRCREYQGDQNCSREEYCQSRVPAAVTVKSVPVERAFKADRLC
jgi:hypothetical protein